MPTLTIELIATVVTPGWARAITPTIALALSVYLLVTCRKAIRQTTLISAWSWSLAALASWGAVEIFFAIWPASAAAASGSAIRLAVLSLNLCPVVALMGAKRPQDKAWNFVVLSFWVVLMLPAAETLLLHPGQQSNLSGARAWFLWAPVLLGVVSYVPTRFWTAAVWIGLGQIIALSPFLALLNRALTPEHSLVGLLCVLTGLVLAWLTSRCATVANSDFDRQWIDFRNTFGLFWALRVQERVNAVAAQNGWNVALRWGGFQDHPIAGGPIPFNTPSATSPQAAFRGLLRRFVGPEWLLARTADAPPCPKTDKAADTA